jgi:hypothetical protein
MWRTMTAAAVVILGGLVAPSYGEDEPSARPAAPQEWLEPYAEAIATPESYDALRERLFRAPDEGDVIRGLAWLVHAKDPHVRQTVARALGNAYMLGDHLGDAFDDALVPAVRALARDADTFTRSCLLSELLRYDSPLAREIALAYVREEIPVPDSAAGEKLVRRARGLLTAGADRMDPVDLEKLEEVLRTDDPKVIGRWIAGATERPAGPHEGRFVTLDVRRGAPRAVELRADRDDPESAFTITVSCLGHEVVRSDPERAGRRRSPPRVTSIDSVTVCVRPGAHGPEPRPAGAGGAYQKGAALYSWGACGFGDDFVHKVVRYLGDDTIRVWVRPVPIPRSNRMRR